jgi:hypothetical protein
MSFSRVGFVGYTATPFANIFVDPSTKSGGERFGPDLFPRSFIVNLRAFCFLVCPVSAVSDVVGTLRWGEGIHQCPDAVPECFCGPFGVVSE